MQFLRTLFWVVVAVTAAIFSFRNWTPVPVNLWGGLQAVAKLPVLLFGAFLLGFLPMFILLRASRWTLRRRLDACERSLSELRALDTPAAGETAAPEIPDTSPAPIPAPAVAAPPVS